MSGAPQHLTQASQINALWAHLLLEELCRLGVRHLCIAPGSRSAPLTLAAANQPGLRCHPPFDERGLGFFAVGLAQGVITSYSIHYTKLYDLNQCSSLSPLGLRQRCDAGTICPNGGQARHNSNVI